MMSIEVAYAVRNYTDYYMGCPTENPGPGLLMIKLPLMFKQGQQFKWQKLILIITMKIIKQVLVSQMRIGRATLLLLF